MRNAAADNEPDQRIDKKVTPSIAQAKEALAGAAGQLSLLMGHV